jgi:hypothetical protein
MIIADALDDANGSGRSVATRRAGGSTGAGKEGCADEAEDQDGAVTEGDGKARRFGIVLVSMSETDGSLPLPTPPAPKEPWTRQHIINISAIVVAAIIGVGTLGTWRTNVARSDDEQLNNRIDSRINQNATLIGISKKLDDAIARLARIEGWREGVTGQVKLLKQSQENQKKEQNTLGKQIAQQQAINKLQDPTRIFVSLRQGCMTPSSQPC